MIDGDQKLVLGETKLAGHQVPGKLDCVFLEIIAKGEIAEHLEKGMVARSIADIFEVIVLAACADAFLRCHGAVVAACLKAGEQVLELHHAGIGEHQRRVVLWHKRAGGHDLVAVGPEIIKKGGSDVVNAAHHSVLQSSMGEPCSGNATRKGAWKARHDGHRVTGTA